MRTEVHIDRTNDTFQIETERLVLRCPREDDAAAVAALMTPAISCWLASWPSPVSAQDVLARIIEAHAASKAGQALHWLVQQR
jgi:ribosomal-protein-alanine N-acetyltransferase